MAASGSDDPLGELRRKGKETLLRLVLEEEGGSYRVGELAELLGESPAKVLAMQATGDFLGVIVDSEVHFPKWQFDGGKPLHGLGPVLRVFRTNKLDSTMMLQWLLVENMRLEGRRPIDMLRDHAFEESDYKDFDEMCSAASMYGEHSAA